MDVTLVSGEATRLCGDSYYPSKLFTPGGITGLVSLSVEMLKRTHMFNIQCVCVSPFVRLQ